MSNVGGSLQPGAWIGVGALVCVCPISDTSGEASFSRELLMASPMASCWHDDLLATSCPSEGVLT